MGAPEVAKKALKFADEFGLSHDSYKEFHPLIIYYSKQVRPPAKSPRPAALLHEVLISQLVRPVRHSTCPPAAAATLHAGQLHACA